MSRWSIHVGDCRDVLAKMPEASVDSIVTDPPYGLEFMGKEWDHGVPGVPFWVEALRVAKPGSHLLAFGGTRTWHRLACALEDAGWEIRDTICWMYGSGFPKSKNLDGVWEGWGTALKPAFEPIILARKPLAGTVAANVERHGVGALNIDGCRVATAADDQVANHGRKATVNGWDPRMSGGQTAGQTAGQRLGRWPANVILDEEAGAMLDAQTGVLAPGASPAKKGLGSARVFGDQPRSGVAKEREQLDGGGASRFFYCAKASKSERNAGVTEGTNDHPTVKPLSLMRYLVKLVTPPNGLVLDPFTGSGTTGCACMYEGFRFVGVEQDAKYARIVSQRIAHHEKEAAK